MALKGISSGGGDFEPVSEGTHIARLIQIVDMGIQRDEYQGQVTEYPKLWLTFEIPGETVTIDGKEKPKIIGMEVTASFGPKAKLPKFVSALDPKAELGPEYDMTTLLGKGAMINIGRTKGGKAKITSAVALPKGQTVEASDAPLVAFDFDDQDQEVLKSLPEFLQKKIKGALNAVGSANADLPEVM